MSAVPKITACESNPAFSNLSLLGSEVLGKLSKKPI